jgi:hydrogenase maturation protease
MARTLVIGYGNPLRGDDGLGWRIVDRLAKMVAGEKTKILAVHQLTPELAEPISASDLVIFVDASYQGEPGSWRCEAIAPNGEVSNALAHYFTPVGLLGYADALFRARPRSLLISVAALSFDCSDQLSSNIEAVIPDIVQYIGTQISWFSQISAHSAVT